MNNEQLLSSYDSLDLLKLPEDLRKNGFNYKLIKRTKDKFIYSQYSGAGSIIGYEVFYNRIKPWRMLKEMWAKKRNDKTDYSDLHEWYETFPGNEEFGKRAWNYKTLDQAMLAFDSK
jgi:hypothetical protein